MPYHIDLTGTIIKTPRLTLRPIKDDDAEDVYAYASVPASVKLQAGITEALKKQKYYCHVLAEKMYLRLSIMRQGMLSALSGFINPGRRKRGSSRVLTLPRSDMFFQKTTGGAGL